MTALDELREKLRESGYDNLSDEELLDMAHSWASLPDDAREQSLMADRAALARSGVTEDAFSHFHWVITKHEPSPYAMNVWIPELVEAYRKQTGVILDSFRGSGKSFILSLWALFVTGHNPVGSTVLVRINELAAKQTGNYMKRIIEHSAGWSMCFPNVVPDEAAGWSSDGYYIKDSGVDYKVWVEKTGSDHGADPSILPVGVTSDNIIGKHPTNGMYFDDLHNEKNTRSAVEMQKTVDIFRSDIIPTWTRPGQSSPTLAVACTLWHEKDVYHAMMATGMFKHIQQPIMWPDEDGEYISEAMAYNGKRVSLAWPDGFSMEDIVKTEKKNPVQFWRMYLCNLEMMKGLALKREWLHYYPADEIDPSWPVYLAIDFASTMDKLKNRDRDYFALAIGRVIPGGGVVLVGGFRGRISTGEAIEKVKGIASQFPTLQTIGVEKWGKGEEFVTQLLYETNLPILPLPLKGAVVRSKGQRFQEGLAPMFMTSRMWVSDVEDDFIRAFKDEWVGWDGGKSRTGHDDTLDAVYWLAMVARGNLMRIDTPLESIGKTKVSSNPYKGIGRHIGYGKNR
jgi:hypothetical protein